MLSSPVKNCNDFFKNRPPLVIFFVCLISLTVCSFSFAFYVQKNKTIINTDSLKGWERLTGFITERPLCSGKNYDDQHTFQLVQEFTTFITLDLSQFRNYTYVEAFYNLDDWHLNCPNDDGENFETFNVKIQFLVPKSSKHLGEEQTSTEKICAKVYGPQKILPQFSDMGCKESPPKYFQGISKTTLYSKNEKNADSCFDDLKINDVAGNEENFAVYLTELDRTYIYINLMWCSYILVAIIIVILLYAIFHHHQSETKTIHN